MVSKLQLIVLAPGYTLDSCNIILSLRLSKWSSAEKRLGVKQCCLFKKCKKVPCQVLERKKQDLFLTNWIIRSFHSL